MGAIVAEGMEPDPSVRNSSQPAGPPARIIIPGEPQASPAPVRIAVEATHDAVVGTCYFCKGVVRQNTFGGLNHELGIICIVCAQKVQSARDAYLARVRYCAKGT